MTARWDLCIWSCIGSNLFQGACIVDITVAPVLSSHSWLIPCSNMKIKFWSWHIRYCCFHSFCKFKVEIQNKWNVYFTLHGSLLYCSPIKSCVFVERCYFKFSLSSKVGKNLPWDYKPCFLKSIALVLFWRDTTLQFHMKSFLYFTLNTFNFLYEITTSA